MRYLHPAAICLLFLLCLGMPLQTQAIEMKIWTHFNRGTTLEAGTPPAGTAFPLVYYLAIQPGRDKAPRYDGYLAVSADYALRLVKADGSSWPPPKASSLTQVYDTWDARTADIVIRFNEVPRHACDGEFFCTSSRERAPAHTWNALAILVKSLLTREAHGKAVLTMGQQPDPSFVPRFVWNKKAKRYDCVNLKPGMTVLDSNALQTSPLGDRRAR